MRILAIGLLALSLFGQFVLTNGTKTVTTAGTAVALKSTPTLATWVTVQALAANTGTICVGSSTVLTSSKNATCLTAGQAAPMYAVPGVAYDLSTIYIDASVNGEGVSYTYAR